MKNSPQIESLLQLMADIVYAIVPRSRPSINALENCKIVSHRGEHDNGQVKENTLAAFDAVVERGIWGIEFDVRWTRDLQPVVIHDADCRRVFGSPMVVSEVTLEQLQSEIPEIPSLEQVLYRYAGKAHFMIELKQQEIVDLQVQQERLLKKLSFLMPVQDYHILALSHHIFEQVAFLPASALLPVAEFNVNEFSSKAIQENYAGISGQYLLIGKKTILRHSQLNQKLGTGFVRSRYCFYRELNRGVEWVFTNRALRMHSIRSKLLESRRNYRPPD